MRIGKKLGLNKTTCTSMSNQLRTAYERYILPFEKYKNAICELKEEHEHCLSLNKKNFSVYKRNKPEIPDDCLRDCSLKRSSETSPVTVCKDDIEKEKVDSYGFPPGSHYTLTTFKIKADNFKKNYFGTLAVPSSQVELEFWDIIKRRRAVSVEYGADLQTSKLGSGFPSARHMTDHLSHYDASHGWNLNNLPLHKNCVLSGFGSNISGMTVPWLYVGMCFATFCWHVEDHYTYSVNYLHKGDKKIWYGVPGHEGGNFETVARKLMPALFEEQPDLLCHLTTMIHPNVLMQQGIPVYRIEQNPGEFVITFPRAYHAGFNQGFNFAEAVNFTPADWIPWGRQCVSDYTAIGRHHVFSHDEMLCFIASKAVGLTPELAAYVAADLYTSIQLEKEARKKFLAYTNFPRDAKILQTASIEFEKIPDEKRTCKYCRCTCFLSAVVCISCDIYADCHVETISLWHAQSFARDRLVGGDSQGGCLSPSWKHVSCLTHLTDLCSCPLSMKFLLYRYTMEELNVLLINICGRNKASV
ncbi:lysine-specific demethylase 5C-like [Zophobas morio]|uniref:lysine-specific demethylase 5C-like n=1 Tax=Zophobas morio TaxID=2755281 RepID=UPI00308291B2